MKTYKDAQRQKQANTIKGSGNPNWKGGRIPKICVRCSSPFLVYPSGNHHTHCSLTCANRDIADAQKGIVNSKKIHYGESNGSWHGGKKTYICQWCGDEFKAYSLAVHKFCSKRCAKKFQFTGETNPNWKGGITPLNEIIRNSADYKIWRIGVFKRDDYTCQKCMVKGGRLEAHHIKPFATHPELRFDVDNGRTLCKDCHENNGYHDGLRITDAKS